MACMSVRMIEDYVCVHNSDRDQSFGFSGSPLASWRPELASSMGQFFDEPAYPVIDKAPGFWTTVGNYGWKEWATFTGCTAACYPFGWVVGNGPKVPKQTAATAAMIGGLFGFMLAYQQSSGRLMGFFPNDKEVETGLANKRQ